MNSHVFGIWIDHSHAQLVEMQDGQRVANMIVESFVEPRHRSTGQKEVPLPGRLGGNTESHDRNRRAEELCRYYDRVIERIPGDSSLVIMGPGEARNELAERMSRFQGLCERVVLSEATRLMSLAEIIDRIHRMTNAEVAS